MTLDKTMRILLLISLISSIVIAHRAEHDIEQAQRERNECWDRESEAYRRYSEEIRRSMDEFERQRTREAFRP